MPIRDEAPLWKAGLLPTPGRAEAEAYCRKLATVHYENFPVVSWALPLHLRQPFYNVYAYCRWADDLGDEIGPPKEALEFLSWWRGELRDCFHGRTRHPVFVALAATITEFKLPIEPFEDLISAFEQDQTVRDYQTFEQLQDYCRRSANPVGRIVLALCGVDSPEARAWSDSICTGLQLANFWQDVERDQAMGRVYLPREDRSRFGYSDTDLKQRVSTPEFVELLRFEVDRAREYLLSGRSLVRTMPGRLQVDIDLFIQGGLRILREIERIEYRVWERRPVISKPAMLWLFATTLLRGAVRWLYPRTP